jgi:predicted MPP superfamily phosphohydrolase
MPQSLDTDIFAEMAKAYAPDYIHVDELERHVKSSTPLRKRSRRSSSTLNANRDDVWQSERTPSNFWQRAAMRLAPLYNTIYDWQMTLGGGVREVRHKLNLAHYPRTAASLKIAFMSDLHLGPTSGRVAARQAWKIARDSRPDVLLLGGDFLYADERGLPTLLRELQRWKRDTPLGGMYACLGNHDYEAGSDTLIMALEACGVRVLVNESVELPHPWRGVWICGTDDPDVGEAQPSRALENVPTNDCVILLSHSPQVLEHKVVTRCDLTVCGDTHGGQICWPNGEPLHMPSQWGRDYMHGMYRHAGNWVFVSRGVGTIGVPLRLWAPPDVGILEIAERSGRF